MIQLCVLFIITIALAYILKIRIERLLAVSCMVMAILVYSFGLLVNLKLSVFLAMAVMMVFTVMMGIYFGMSGKLDNNIKNRVRDYILTPQIIIILVVCLITCIAYSGHMVIHWDDLNVWGIYPKTLFELNKIPTGLENCSITYKDYQPVQQIMQYFVLLGSNSFNEATLFRVNVCFMYILMSPVLGMMRTGSFKKKEGASDSVQNRLRFIIQNVAVVLLYLIFPHVFSTQSYMKLGVDYLMALLFGYGMYTVWNISDSSDTESRTDRIMSYVTLSVVMTYLSLIKSSGIILATILGLLLLVVTKINLPLIVTGAAPVMYYLSWKLFARRTGNTGYMSQAIDSNIRSIIKPFPKYTGNVLGHYIKNVFIYPLTRQKIGVTAAILILFIILIQVLCKKTLNKKLVITAWIGFALFCIGHIYMYLFVFDDWEAYGLLEYDRYICQYLAGYMLFSIIVLLKNMISDTSASGNRIYVLTGGILAVFIILFPYQAALDYLIPSNYEARVYSQVAGAQADGIYEWEMSGIKEKSIPNDEDHRIMIMTDAWNDASIFMTYEAVPQVFTCYANVPAVEVDNLTSFTIGQIENRHIKYVYVTSFAADSFQGDFAEESKGLSDDGRSLEQGLYEVNEELRLHRVD